MKNKFLYAELFFLCIIGFTSSDNDTIQFYSSSEKVDLAVVTNVSELHWKYVM